LYVWKINIWKHSFINKLQEIIIETPPNMENEKVLEALTELKEEVTNMHDYNALTNWKNHATNIIVRIYGQDSQIINQISDIRQYSAESVPGNKRKATALIESLIKEIERFGIPKLVEKNNDKNLSINITQNQNQTTQISLNLLIESIQHELKGGQLKELQTIIDEKNIEPTEKKNKIVDALKKFGGDVASNIVANILTNPSLFG
jgi:ferritin-like protein